MTTFANLQTLRDDAIAKLDAILVNPKPSYSIGGEGSSRSISWGEYQNLLRETIRTTTEALIEEAKLQQDLNPFWVETRNYA